MQIRLTRFQKSLLSAPIVGALCYMVPSYVVAVFAQLLGYTIKDFALLEALFALGLMCSLGIIFIPTAPIVVALIYGVSWLGTLLMLPLILLLKNKTTNLLPFMVLGALGGYILGEINLTFLASQNLALNIVTNRFAYIMPGITYMSMVWFYGIRITSPTNTLNNS